VSANRILGAVLIAAALALSGCGKESAAPAPAPAAKQETAAAPQATGESKSAETPAASETAQPAEAPKPSAEAFAGPEPKENVDYFYIDPPQPLNQSPGEIEVAEVFSYTCIHCQQFDPLVPAFKASLPEKAKFVYVPTSFGAFEQIARAFYAAQALGVQEKLHTALFKAMVEERKIKRGDAEEVVGLYKELGVNGDELAAAMKSFAVNAQIARAQKTLARWGIEGTPTIVVAGKYRVVAGAGGHQGMLRTARWLVDKELAAAAEK